MLFLRGNSNSFNQWLITWLDDISRIPDLKESYCLQLFCTLWMIWKARNDFIHQGQNPNPLATIIQTNNIISYYACQRPPFEASQSGPRAQFQNNRNWRDLWRGSPKSTQMLLFHHLMAFALLVLLLGTIMETLFQELPRKAELLIVW